MRHAPPLALAAALLAAPALAQEAEGPSLFEQGADLLLRGLIEEAAPAIEELAGIGEEWIPTLQALTQQMGPAFLETFRQVDSIANYEPPTFLPNGDILIRRSPEAPAWTPPEAEAAEPGPEIEL